MGNNSGYKRSQSSNSIKTSAAHQVSKTQTLPRNSKLFGSRDKDIVFKKDEEATSESVGVTLEDSNTERKKTGVFEKQPRVQGRQTITKPAIEEEKTPSTKIKYKELPKKQTGGAGLFTITEWNDS